VETSLIFYQTHSYILFGSKDCSKFSSSSARPENKHLGARACRPMPDGLDSLSLFWTLVNQVIGLESQVLIDNGITGDQPKLTTWDNFK